MRGQLFAAPGSSGAAATARWYASIAPGEVADREARVADVHQGACPAGPEGRRAPRTRRCAAARSPR